MGRRDEKARDEHRRGRAIGAINRQSPLISAIPVTYDLVFWEMSVALMKALMKLEILTLQTSLLALIDESMSPCIHQELGRHIR